MERGTCGFEVTSAGDLVDRANNVELLRKLWLDRSIISGNDLGEGDPGDFDHGAWHIACHLVAAAGVCRDHDGRLLWAEISHRSVSDESSTGPNPLVPLQAVRQLVGRELNMDDATMSWFHRSR